MSSLSSDEKKELFYVAGSALFCVIAILANIITVKLFPLSFIKIVGIPCGLLIYPFTFFIGNLITELFGKQKAQFMIFLSFLMTSVAYFIIRLALSLPSTDQATQIAFEKVFSANGIMLLSSLLAYLASQMIDINLYLLIKKWTHSQHLWLRTCCSMVVAQFVDACIVNIGQLHFGLHLEGKAILELIFFCYFYKLIIGLSLTPFFYMVVMISKKWMQSEESKINLVPDWKL